MKYAELGKSGAMVSRLGFGAMRLEAHSYRETLRRAYELGINYYDSGFGYCGGKSEEWLGEALEQVRGNVYYATKSPIMWEGSKTRARWREIFEEQLCRLRTDYIDFYHGIHSMNWQGYRELWLGKGIWKEARRQMELGRIKHLYFSWHDDAKHLLKVIRNGAFSGMTVQYNLLDRSNEAPLTLARKRGMGTVVMGPVGGGRLEEAVNMKNFFKGVKTKTSPEAALRFVFSNADVETAISGMSSVKQVEENVRTVNELSPLNARERKAIDKGVAKLSGLARVYCTSCGYCKPVCAEKVEIPANLGLLISYKVYGQKKYARDNYRGWGRNAWKAEKCTQCGACLEHCPQKIPIPDRLKEMVKLLSD